MAADFARAMSSDASARMAEKRARTLNRFNRAVDGLALCKAHFSTVFQTAGPVGNQR
jgi:hypothetical protein